MYILEDKHKHTAHMKKHSLNEKCTNGVMRTCTLYLQSILLSAAYLSGLKSFAVITSEKWVTLKERKNMQILDRNIEMLYSHRPLFNIWTGAESPDTVPCLVRWVPAPPLWWCSTKYGRTGQTRRCGTPGHPVSGSICWVGLASGLSPQRDSTTPTVCLHSHLSLGKTKQIHVWILTY